MRGARKTIILHSDMNNFYASVECMKNPELKDKYVAVCGNPEDRHGIVLAKNERAKALGVKTGEPVWQALQKCPFLITVAPHFDEYVEYSKRAREIYYRYTDLIEPFGLDECWLDVSGSTLLFGDGRRIADLIREDIRRELGLTVSVGVSFNKVFAKLGSDMKKPDAVTCISEEDFRSIVWRLNASEMIGVGRATAGKLRKHGIYTIGDIASAKPEYMQKWLGKNGIMLWNYANGRGGSRVSPAGSVPPVKSIGHGVTCTSDLGSDTEVRRVLLALSTDVSRRLRQQGLMAEGISVSVKDTSLLSREFQRGTNRPVRNSAELAGLGFELFKKNYDWEKQVRALSIRAIKLVSENKPVQVGLFDNISREMKRDRIEESMEGIREMYGKRAVMYGSLLCGLKLPGDNRINRVMPGGCRV
ncbi:MAG TPA: DNA polymerase IV [Candidatus Monoglobus merdigallinarum]|uniref:DNA polymerase IV n=1 Tax=Candidatus Monoglobus merdigallinarum TaxID=2838698 RepID=A0A9D1PQY6_9FIRM|nr:DNA polymerase IV [Candidatus Monoglobus merdigallinarum]